MNNTAQGFESLCSVASANLRVLCAEMTVMRALKRDANSTVTTVTKKLEEEIIPEIEMHDPVIAEAIRDQLNYQLGRCSAPLRHAATACLG